jgi:ATPase family associated with various cellular activities (AAA)
MDGVAGTKASSLADQVTHLSDTIHACERLCLLSAPTVVWCAVDLGKPIEHSERKRPPQAFIPGLARDLHSARVSCAQISEAVNRHPATSAQCIAALQSLVPVVSRFQLGTPESKGLAFHPIERKALRIFEPDRVSVQIRAAVIAGLEAFYGSESPEPPAPAPAEGAAAPAQSTAPGAIQGPTSSPSSPVAEGPATSPPADAPAGSTPKESGHSSTDQFAWIRLSSTTLGYLHPFTAVQVLRALAPSRGLFGPVWWRSLFIILWFINRRASSLRGYPNTQSTQSPGTAFLTSKCIDAIEAVYEVFERRRNRFEKLTYLVKELKEVQDSRRELTKLDSDKLISAETFGPGYVYKGENLVTDIEACMREIAADTGLQSMYQDWNSAFKTKMQEVRQAAEQRRDPNPDHTKILILVVDTLVEAIEGQRDKNKGLQAANQSEIDGFNTTAKEIRIIHRQIEKELKKSAQVAQAADPDIEQDAELIAKLRRKIESTLTPMQSVSDQVGVGMFPKWICSTNYWEATSAILKGTLAPPVEDSPRAQAERENYLRNLENHWRRHCDAADHASKTLDTFNTYVKQLFQDDFAVLAGEVRKAEAAAKSATPEGQDSKASAELEEKAQDEKIGLLVGTLSRASQRLSRLHEHLWRYIETGVRSADILMHRHLTYGASGAIMRFDANELAHAVRVVCRDGNKLRFNTILTALRVVCESQRPDGTWSCQQPFYWTETGQSASTLSVETALAMASTVNVLLRNSERFGASLEEVSAGLQPVYEGLDRFFHWLSGSVQSFPEPPALEKASSEPQAWLYGWCSDRVYEPGRIHSWVTAVAIEFLVEFRRLLQVRINSLLRAEFLSHHPSELGRLSEVEPTDLESLVEPDDSPVIAQMLHLLRPHKALEFAEGPWLPSSPPEASLTLWSGILYGPPGTSKTFLAKAIAGELEWPLISLSPSDFLARGDQDIESRSREIFTSLSAGSRLVYFFDEIDELIRDRGQMERERRSVFSFLTPSFLTKLQDFRDQAKKNEFIFILGTNYYDRIDAAAKRSGRIDRAFVVAYPDLPSRSYIILRLLLKALAKNKPPVEQFGALRTYLRAVQDVLPTATFPGDTQIFIDLFAIFAGFLSYPKMKDLSDRLAELTLKKTEGAPQVKPDVTPENLTRMIGEMRAIARGDSPRFKPEISLSEYAERPGVFDDEVVKVVKSIPAVSFPWVEPPPPDGTAGADAQLKTALRELYEAVKKLDKPWEVKSKYEEHLSGYEDHFPVWQQ